LPKAAQDYVRTIEELSGAPVSAVGVGPRRDQTLQLRPLL
ncbi:MAG TPA: adenylosuccinate synthetase, partial [Trebonia sp.]|nr:adenylosuccinate synthetase [Trebonia sp.]